MTALDPRTPVIVGAAQVLFRDQSGEEPREPVALMVDVLRAAAADSGAGERLLRRAQSLRCVPVIGWPYEDVAALVAEDLRLQPRETVQSALIGGEGPQALVNDTAHAIAAGQLDVALLVGGEAVGSLRAAQLAGRRLEWRRRAAGAWQPARTLPGDRRPVNDAEAAAGLTLPVYTYALIEGALRRAEASSPAEHLAQIASLWARLSAVGEHNRHAWIPRAYTPEQIATPARENRLVASPYTKLMTANIRVNMAAGLIMVSADAARRLGVASERWVFPWAGAQAQDHWHVSERHELAASPSIQAMGQAALGLTGLSVDEIAHIDPYSCFPAAVQVAARELGVTIDDRARTPTVTGGLTFAGGPGNNYCSHAIASLVERLRADPQASGLVTAVGWYLTKHALGIYSGRAPRGLFASLQPHPQQPAPRRLHLDYSGPATVETYTLAYDRDGTAEAAIVSALTPGGQRVLVRSQRPEVIAALLSADALGQPVDLAADGRLAFG